MINAYTVMLLFVLGTAVLMHGNRAKNKYFIIVAGAAMFILLGFRDAYSVGGDSSSSYLHEFQRKENESWSDVWSDNEYHKFFFLFMKLVYVMTNGNYQMFIIIISVFVMLAFGKLIYEYSCDPIQSIIYYMGLLYYTFHFNALKQSVAMSFLIFAFDAMMKKKPVRYLLFIFLATMFHFPAIVFLPAYFIVSLKLGRSYLFVLAGLLALTYIFRDRILEIMTDIYDTDIIEHDMRFLANKVLIMILIVVAGLILRPPTPDDRLYGALLSLLGVAIVLQTFANYNNTFERLADYYFQFSAVFIPLVFQKIELKKNYLSQRILVIGKTLAPIAFCAFGVYRFLKYPSSANSLLPYKFFF